MKNYFSIRSGGEDRAVQLELSPDLIRVRQIPIVAKGDLAAMAVDQKGLGFPERYGSRGGVSDVPDGGASRMPVELFFTENIADVAHAEPRVQDPAIRVHDTRPS